MVFFICDTCQETVKKNKVESHCNQCRDCWTLVCVDCSKSFHGNEYRTHSTCISEAEKYQGALYRAPKQKVKRNPQGEWIAALHRSAEDPAAPAHIKRVLSRLQNCGDNVPRKLKKFINFSMNSLQMRGRDALLTQTFEFIMSHWPKPAPKPAAGASETKQEGDAGASTDESKSDSPGSGSGSAAAGDDDTPAPLAKKAKKEKKVKKDKKAKKDKAAEATVTTDSVGASKKRPRAEEDDGASVSPKRARGTVSMKKMIKRTLRTKEGGMAWKELRDHVCAGSAEGTTESEEFCKFYSTLLDMKNIVIQKGIVKRA